ncbi:MAG: MBL fold metallo-hydrolase [Deltaproteobacteria bacterium]|nr:MBL fold metallo-hydrolase [Deltaproteobacteria bacterium]MBI3389624.1 MBL fold metallo-hydrolase [Deltaproteobacteria bacterium]
MKGTPALRVRFWGVRGSYPTPGPATARIGGNSSCVEVTSAKHTLAFDAGTGIIGLGRELMHRNGDPTVYVFLSHLHHDHIEGLRYFAPAYNPRWTCHIYGAGGGAQALQRLLARTMTPRLFPVSLSQLPANLAINNLDKQERIRLNGSPATVITARYSNAHPKVGVTLYRVTCGGRSVVYATDVEAPLGGHDDVVAFARGADVLIHDAQYTDAEYHGTPSNKAGWGHSTVRMAAEAARAAKVGELILYHHDPEHDDAEVRRLEKLARTIFPRTRAASEGLELHLAPR